MKFGITITEDVIRKSLMCGVKSNDSAVGSNCAFAIAYNELIPNVWISKKDAYLYPKNAGMSQDDNEKHFAMHPLTPSQRAFINLFDSLRHTPEKRQLYVGEKFEVEIPDEVIDYWYKDASDAATAIANCKSLQPIQELSK